MIATVIIVFTSKFEMLIFSSFFAFLFGLIVGSFLNVLVFRFNKRESFSFWQSIQGRSKCPYCHHQLKWFELIPLLSFFFLKGRCRYCRKPISYQYPLVELFSGILSLVVFLRIFYFFPSLPLWQILPLFLIFLFFFFLLFLLSLLDLKTYLIPKQIVDFLLLWGVFFNLFYTFKLISLRPDFLGYFNHLFFRFDIPFLDSLLGALIVAGFCYLLAKISQEKALGFGDVKVFFALSFLFPWPEIFFIFVLSFVLGGIYAFFALLFLKKTRKSKVPFLPFIFLASLLFFSLSSRFLSFYSHLFF